jgi:hypothetical protein
MKIRISYSYTILPNVGLLLSNVWCSVLFNGFMFSQTFGVPSDIKHDV